ncbi:MAG: hypothetical protein RQ824_07115 [bacterium]|nr:hypothetical protein [bacterium]
MHLPFKRFFFTTPLLASLLLSSCASTPKLPSFSELKAYRISADKSLFASYSPLFIIENHEERFNLIGTAVAEMSEDEGEKIFVDHSRPTIYTERRGFKTSKGSYTNLIYRIHFKEVPFGLIPFHIGQGENVGLFTIVTLNSNEEPLLYTTVHTCGCYIAFVPTSFMPDDAFPDGWEEGRQTVFGESLPGLLDYSGLALNDTKAMLLIREGSHRVKDMWLARRDSLNEYDTVIVESQALMSLEKLPLKEGTTSFYETSGPRKGYVKGSQKIWERLLMSWWAFDWRIGEDKKLGKDKDDGPLFYTSLKPWAREDSDLRDFANFLKYWGWKL